MGPERKSLIMREEERMNTAYHESGHAVVANFLPNADPVHKVTIMPRGMGIRINMATYQNLIALVTLRLRCLKKYQFYLVGVLLRKYL